MKKLNLKTISKNWSRLALQTLCVVPLGLLGFACDGLLSEEPAVGGESSFLRFCAGSCGDGLECISNVCTQGCLVSKDTCGRIDQQASCTNASIESGSVAVCDVACTRDNDCARLGSRFHCEAGFCRGSSQGTSNGQGGSSGTTVATSPGGSPTTSGGASGIGGAMPTTIGTPTAGSCRVAYQEYASGTTGIPIADGTSCGSCTCTNGQLECVKSDDCPLGSPVVACPADLKTDAVDERLAFIAGDSLSLTVRHGGGCATHDYALCYKKELGESLPEYAWLHVIHDGHGDSCDAYLSKPLRFDLRPLASYLSATFPSTHLVNTAYGLYSFGDSGTCIERSDAAGDQIKRSVDATIKTCTSKTDCEVLDTSTVCYPSCGAVVSNATPSDPSGELGKSELAARVAAVNAAQCSPMQEQPCNPRLVNCAALVPDCVNGQCVNSAQ